MISADGHPIQSYPVPGWISGSGNRRYTSGRDGLRPTNRYDYGTWNFIYKFHYL